MKNRFDKFFGIEYLKSGNSRQKKAYEILTELKLFELLKSFNPLLAGTIPIEIDIDISDLDVLCTSDNLNGFGHKVSSLYGRYKGFHSSHQTLNGQKSYIANFSYKDVSIEIFAQGIDSKKQNAFQHMLAEYDLLEEQGPLFRAQIIELKKTGMKTEPAFAALLNLKGDPYQAILNYYKV